MGEGKEVLVKDVCLVKFSQCLIISGCLIIVKVVSNNNELVPNNDELVPKNDEQLPNDKNQCLIMMNFCLKITKQA